MNAGDQGDQLLRVARRLRRSNTDALAPLGITPHQSRALRIIASGAPPRPSDVASQLHIAARSATEVVDALVSSGWVARSPDPDDRRATRLILTPQGTVLLARIAAVRTAEAERFFARLAADDRATLARLLGVLDA